MQLQTRAFEPSRSKHGRLACLTHLLSSSSPLFPLFSYTSYSGCLDPSICYVYVYFHLILNSSYLQRIKRIIVSEDQDGASGMQDNLNKVVSQDASPSFTSHRKYVSSAISTMSINPSYEPWRILKKLIPQDTSSC